MAEKKYIADERQAQVEYKTLQMLQEKANEALKTIVDLQDIPCKSLEELTKENVMVLINQRICEVDKTTFLTDSNKKTIIQEWRGKQKIGLKALANILAFVDACQDAEVTIKDGKLSCCMDLHELAETRCRLLIPNEAQIHWQLIENLRNALNNLRDFESENDCKNIALGAVCGVFEDEILRAWATNDIKRDHRFDAIYNRDRFKRILHS